MNDVKQQAEDPVRFTRLKRWCYVVLGAIVLAEVVLPLMFAGEHPPHFGFEKFPAWGSLYGLASCVVIIVVSKFLGKVWLMRRENYYDS